MDVAPWGCAYLDNRGNIDCELFDLLMGVVNLEFTNKWFILNLLPLAFVGLNDNVWPVWPKQTLVMPKRVRPISKQNARCSQSSKECSKSRQGGPKQPKNGSSNKRNRPSQYCQFDQGTSFVRNHVVHGLANQLLSHRRENGNKTQRGFVQGLIDSANAVNSLLDITRDDVRNEVDRIIAASQKGETPAATLAEGISGTNGDLVSIAASSNSG